MDRQPNSTRLSRAKSPSAHKLFQEIERVREYSTALAGAATHVASGWQMLVRVQLTQQPYVALAVAAGVGYVLGGGVPRVVVRALVGLGGRWAVERAIARFVVAPAL